MTTALIAGAAGLVGSALCRHLLAQGTAVIAVDNLCTGSMENLAELQVNPLFQFLEQDICQPFAITQPLDSIYHMASPASPDDFDAMALDIICVNTVGTRNLLDLAKTHNAKLLFASTSEVYGNPLVHPQIESYWGNVNPNGERSCYDESKRLGESIVSNYSRLHGVRYTLARIFNTYGPRMRAQDGRVVPNFLLQAIRKQPLELHGGGQQTRSFCYVDDLVRGLVGLMESQVTDGDVYNVGNPNECTIEAFARTLSRVADIDLTLTPVPSPRRDDPERRRPDISKIKAAIGWEPQFSLEEGLHLTLADFAARFGS